MKCKKRIDTAIQGSITRRICKPCVKLLLLPSLTHTSVHRPSGNEWTRDHHLLISEHNLLVRNLEALTVRMYRKHDSSVSCHDQKQSMVRSCTALSTHSTLGRMTVRILSSVPTCNSKPIHDRQEYRQHVVDGQDFVSITETTLYLLVDARGRRAMFCNTSPRKQYMFNLVGAQRARLLD